MKRIFIMLFFGFITVKLSESEPKWMDNTTWIVIQARIDYFNALRLNKDHSVYHFEIPDSFIINPNKEK